MPARSSEKSPPGVPAREKRPAGVARHMDVMVGTSDMVGKVVGKVLPMCGRKGNGVAMVTASLSPSCLSSPLESTHCMHARLGGIDEGIGSSNSAPQKWHKLTLNEVSVFFTQRGFP